MDMEQFRARLLIEQRETVEAIQQAQQSAAPVELDQSCVGRVSRIDALQQQALAQGLRERLTIRKRKVETVRYYEKEGLLPAPARTAANYRSYGSAHIDRLRFIRNCRALNMTHEEIRALLGFMDQPAGDCGAVNQLLDEHIAHVDVRIAELSQLKRQLSELRQRCRSEQSVDACGILHGLASMETEPRHERHTHIG